MCECVNVCVCESVVGVWCVVCGVVCAGPVYHVPAAIGMQPNSRIRNSPRPGFGASSRATRDRVFMGTEYAADPLTGGGIAMPNVATPGPAGPYDLTPAIGKQPHSRRGGGNATSPRAAFSKTSRWADYEREVCGPSRWLRTRGRKHAQPCICRRNPPFNRTH